MKLGIEYLVRTGAIRKFFNTPCSLFLNPLGDQKPMVVVVEFCESPAYKVSQFILNDSIPERRSYEVPNVFDSDLVAVPGYCPIEYKDSFFPKGWNSYRHPMDDYLWDRYYNQLLNSENHRRQRERWLWRHFCHVFFNEFVSQQDVRTYIPSGWSGWSKWRNQLLIESPVAAELIFKKSFDGPKLILPSSFSSS